MKAHSRSWSPCMRHALHCLLYPNPSAWKDQAQTCPGSRFLKLPLSPHHLIKGSTFKLTELYLYRLESEWLVVPSVLKVSQRALQGNMTSTKATQSSSGRPTQLVMPSSGIIKPVFIGRAEREGMLAGSFPMYFVRVLWLFKFHLNNQLRQICFYQKVECDDAKLMP